MALKDLRNMLDEEIKLILSSEFKVTITETEIVPSIDDPNITYPNLMTKEQKCKLIETCVLYIDIRRSTELNLTHRRETVTKLYSAFIRSMVKAAEEYGGKVRGIVGDRVMVVFDKHMCFKNAANTAILMNSISQYLLNKHFDKNEFKCGIGIDYGKMLVSKNGIIKQGSENTSSKSLVWLGRPANLASKLTDTANKSISTTTEKLMVNEGHYYGPLQRWGWYEYHAETFLDKLESTYSPILKHKDSYFNTFFYKNKMITSTVTTPPILISKSVYDGLKAQCPNEKAVKEGWWKKQTNVNVSGYNGEIYGGGVIFTEFQ